MSLGSVMVSRSISAMTGLPCLSGGSYFIILCRTLYHKDVGTADALAQLTCNRRLDMARCGADAGAEFPAYRPHLGRAVACPRAGGRFGHRRSHRDLGLD